MEDATGSQVWQLRNVTAPRFATLGDRVLAQVVDGLIGLGLFFFIGVMLAVRFGVVTDSGFELSLGPALLLIGLAAVMMLSYFVLAEAMLGATLGKVVAQIKVENDAGQRASLLFSLIRNVMRLIDAIGFYLVGAISVMVTKRNQRLGDLAAGTVVVRSDSGPAARLVSLAAALFLGIGGIVGGSMLGGSSLVLPPTLDQYAPKASDVVIKAVSLSSGESTDLNPAAIGTEFPEGARRVVVWYQWEAAMPGHRVDVRWSKDGVIVLEQGEPLTQPTGSSAWFLDMANGGPLSAGHYEVELQENGKRVTVIPFRIGR
jgi:uncharacterized RDD family membrane protein YckC